MSRRIGIILFGYGLGNSPSLINSALFLASHGYDVDFFTCSTYLGDSDLFNDPSIIIHDYPDKPDSENLPKVFRILKNLWLSQKLSLKTAAAKAQKYEMRILARIRKYVKWIIEEMDGKPYDCLIGVEPFGLAAASMIKEKKGFNIVYYNLELWLSKEVDSMHDRLIKKVEIMFCHEAAFVITLDTERARLLAEDNNIQPERFVIVPVCADGPRFEDRSNYFNDKFGIPAEKKIILYAGFLSAWALCEELAIAALKWPEDWILILHSHGYQCNRYVDRLKQYEGSKVLFSLDPVPYEALASVLSSATVGIALYKDTGKNFNLIDSASGKLAHYLKSGLPVVVNDFPSIKGVVERYNCGISVRGPEEVSAAVTGILNDYERMHHNAFRCYEDNYLFSKHFPKVLKRIEAF